MVDNSRRKLHVSGFKVSPIRTGDVWKPGAGEVRLTQLWQAVELRHLIDLEELRLVRLDRAAGVSWGDIGGALGVSAQAAHKRFGSQL